MSSFKELCSVYIKEICPSCINKMTEECNICRTFDGVICCNYCRDKTLNKRSTAKRGDGNEVL